MAKTKPLGRKYAGIDLKKCGDVLARAVCRGKRTQMQVNKIAQQILADVRDGALKTEEDTIVAACKDVGIGRAFAGV